MILRSRKCPRALLCLCLRFIGFCTAGVSLCAAEGDSVVEASPPPMGLGSSLLAGPTLIGGLVFLTALVVFLSWRLVQLKRHLRRQKAAYAEQIDAESGHLKGVLDQLPVPLFFQDSTHRMTFVNRAMADFFGRPSDEFAGETLVDLLSEEAGAELLSWADPLVLWEEGVRTQQTNVINKYGETRRVSISLALSGTENESNAETIGVMTDNTESVNALQAMEDSLDLMTKVTSQVPGVVFEFKRLKGGDFVFPWASVGLQKVFEVSPLDVEYDASFVFDKIHPEDLVRMLQDIEASRIQLRAWKGEYRLRGQPSTERWILVDAVPEAEKSGVISWYGFTADITNIKKIENRLLQAMGEAERANKAKSAFLAAMSHEIRTPMNGVIGMTSLLAQTALDEEQSGYVSTIRNSGDALIVVINDILDFSKIESGHLDLEVSSFEVADCIEGVVDILTPAAVKKGLSLAYFVDKVTPQAIEGDQMRVRQILVNLVGNAIKFTSEGQVFIHVDLVEQASRTYMRIAVEDSGPGIPESRKTRLFKPFTQVDASTSRVFGGTGLGLAISKRLSSLMDGDLSFESVEGEGSSFYFLLPVEEVPVEKRVYSKFKDIYGPMQSKRVLIYDACPLHREVLSCYAKAWGLQPILAQSCSEIMSLIERDTAPIDCLFVDLKTIQQELSSERVEMYLTTLSKRGVKVIEMNDRGLSASRDTKVSIAKPFKAHHVLNALHAVLSSDTAALKKVPTLEVAELKPPSGELKVLLAEDNLVNQKVATMMLKRIGLSADIAINGQEALDACRANEYHVVLMDVQMPVMDGLEATREIRKTNPKSDLCIIGLTANATNSDRELAMDAGMNNYLAKPIKVADLSLALSQAATELGLRPAGESSAALEGRRSALSA